MTNTLTSDAYDEAMFLAAKKTFANDKTKTPVFIQWHDLSNNALQDIYSSMTLTWNQSGYRLFPATLLNATTPWRTGLDTVTFGLNSELSKYVMALFESISEVHLIYEDNSTLEISYYIFTSNEEYDSNLLDKLIDIESKILSMNYGNSISFRYIPLVLCDSPRDVVGETARVLFQR